MTSSQIYQSTLIRKGRALALQAPRLISRLMSAESHYSTSPPILVNSLPKSGTHMLMQMARAIPRTKYYGSFIAQAPSITLKNRSDAKITQKIRCIAPSEVLGAHLHYSENTVSALNQKNALHLFVYRDPRDVILSEVHYLTNMAPWHKMHRKFASLTSTEDRILLAILGDGTETYPDSKERIGKYLGWIEDLSVLSVRYEDLNTPTGLAREARTIITRYMKIGGAIENPNKVIEDLIKSIEPQKSHTFHKGGIARWKNEMNEEAQQMCLDRFPWLNNVNSTQ